MLFHRYDGLNLPILCVLLPHTKASVALVTVKRDQINLSAVVMRTFILLSLHHYQFPATASYMKVDLMKNVIYA